MEVVMKGNALEALFQETVNYWLTHYPDEVKVFDAEVKEARDMCVREDAMTAKKHFLHVGMIPPRVWAAAANMLIYEDVCDDNMARRWEKIPELTNAFFNVFKRGRVNMKTQVSR